MGEAISAALELFPTLRLVVFCPKRLLTLLEGPPLPQTCPEPSEKPKGYSHQLRGRVS